MIRTLVIALNRNNLHATHDRTSRVRSVCRYGDETVLAMLLSPILVVRLNNSQPSVLALCTAMEARVHEKNHKRVTGKLTCWAEERQSQIQ